MVGLGYKKVGLDQRRVGWVLQKGWFGIREGVLWSGSGEQKVEE